jgi:hypothetical protein
MLFTRKIFYWLALLAACVALTGLVVCRRRQADLDFVGYESSSGKVYAVLSLKNRSQRVMQYFEDRNDPEPDAVLHQASVKEGDRWSVPVWDWRAATNCLERPLRPGAAARVKVLVKKQPERVGLRVRIVEPDGPPSDFGTGVGILIWDGLKLGARHRDRTIDVWCSTVLR